MPIDLLSDDAKRFNDKVIKRYQDRCPHEHTIELRSTLAKRTIKICQRCRGYAGEAKHETIIE